MLVWVITYLDDDRQRHVAGVLDDWPGGMHVLDRYFSGDYEMTRIDTEDGVVNISKGGSPWI